MRIPDNPLAGASTRAVTAGAALALVAGSVGVAAALPDQADPDDHGVAEDVHQELTGDEDVQPGDDDFGLTIAEPGGADGPAVAEVASQDRSVGDEGDDTEEDPDVEEDDADENETDDGDENEEEADGEGADHGDADAVHKALTGDPDLEPGDEGFGQAVADNAPEDGGGHGADVAEAASSGRAGGDASQDPDTGEPDEEAGTDRPADQADDRAREATDRQDRGNEADRSEEYRPTDPPEDAGPPADTGSGGAPTNSGGAGNGGNGR